MKSHIYIYDIVHLCCFHHEISSPCAREAVMMMVCVCVFWVNKAELSVSGEKSMASLDGFQHSDCYLK